MSIDDGYISGFENGYGYIIGFSEDEKELIESLLEGILPYSNIPAEETSVDFSGEQTGEGIVEFEECGETGNEEASELRPVDIIYDPPCTRVYWNDGTKTEVKTHNEPFVKEFGYAMALVRKIYGGNRSAFLKDVNSGYTRIDNLEEITQKDNDNA